MHLLLCTRLVVLLNIGDYIGCELLSVNKGNVKKFYAVELMEK
jgi:hypothetical protein